jgi:hypothetical protein
MTTRDRLEPLLNDDHKSAQVFGIDGPRHILGPDDVLTLPELLGDFRVAVRRFFA